MFNDANESRQAVLESAIGAFASKGYAGTSVQDILSVTGLSKPTLYYYFQSKAGLFHAVLDFAYEESFRLMQEYSERVSAIRDKLTEVALALFEFTSRHTDLMRLVLATAFAAPGELPTDAVHPEKRLRFFSFVKELLSTGQSLGELDQRFTPDELAHGILGAITHQVRTFLIRPEAPLDRKRAQGIVSLFLDGASNRNQSPQ